MMNLTNNYNIIEFPKVPKLPNLNIYHFKSWPNTLSLHWSLRPSNTVVEHSTHTSMFEGRHERYCDRKENERDGTGRNGIERDGVKL